MKTIRKKTTYKRPIHVKWPSKAEIKESFTSRFDVLPMMTVRKILKDTSIPKPSIDEVEKFLRETLLSSHRPSRERALEAVKTLIAYIGDDPSRPGLLKTPERVIKAWEEDWGKGYNKKFIQEQTLSILGAEFTDGAENYDQMICERNIPFSSFCEHHLAAIRGVAHVAYIPSKTKCKILGLSKLTRIVNMFSRRLQVQERLTNQIADFIQIHCKPQGVGVVIKAEHDCMLSRGVKSHGTDAVTSALRGDFLTESAVRAEFLALTRE